ncbi:MAG: hypothetical protein M9931_05620 [Chitinophagales bacterium]|nr:hypothetical protein [Chitinophagales bacterium]MCO5280521.1 hypothetical protein [Chitinophagales bacterium]OJV26777.1 MAG: hypothetical protein BGO32_07950 [Bacteroidetes bacterium 37-13]HRN93761.1 hypothetical protein [Chitinophagales bacterium]HRP40082.1 hypothetical protein [Chitinophagales bacterium]
MTFLRAFLCRCTEQERYKLKLLDLKGNEYEVLLETIKQRTNTDFDDTEIQNKFNLTKSYFDKINSVLLDKCLSALTPNGTYNDILSLILAKDMPDLLKHEIKIWERRILKTKDSNEITTFYYRTFQFLRRMPANVFDMEMLLKYKNLYLKHKKDRSEEDELEIAAMVLATQVFIEAVQGNMNTFSEKYHLELKRLKTEIGTKQYYKANFHTKLAEANYYDYYTSDFNALVNALKYAMEHYDKAQGGIDVTYKVYAITKLAKAYCHGSYFGEAMKIYDEAFSLFAAELSLNPYHPTMYAIVAIINGKYKEAEKMMNENLLHLLNNEKPGTLDFDIYRTYAILYMNQSMFDKAFYYLEEALKFRRTEISLLGDILLRMVHNAFFVMSGDLATAKTTLKRNFKFLALKEKDAMVQEYTGYFKMIKQVIRYKEGKKLPKDFTEQMTPYRQGIMKLYGDLLDKMVD